MADSRFPDPYQDLQDRRNATSDAARGDAVQKRHSRGFRTARENLADLVDANTFDEVGQLAMAAQRSRRSLEELQRETAADGVVTGIGRVNGQMMGSENTQTCLIINDYTVLAGTQGYFHHRKIDRALELAERRQLPIVMYTEGGGGRPGDTDALVSMAGLNVPTFHRWSKLAGQVPRIAVNNGYCFAGNAALFGAADLRIATQSSCIGMAGPAMIAGGGLGDYAPGEIGPIAVHQRVGSVDFVAANEADATQAAKIALAFTQGRLATWNCADQSLLRTALPQNRRMAYDVHSVIDVLCDSGSVLELRACFGRAVVTAMARIEGRPVAILASDCRHLGGAIDSDAARKSAEFFQLANRWGLPIVSLIDTPGFMVGPKSEAEGAAAVMPAMFNAAAAVDTPWIAVFLRRGYGLGAMAMAGGSFAVPSMAVSWPQGEFGGMGLEGAVALGYRRELDAVPEGPERAALFEELLADLYAKGRATEAAAHLEFDAVIDPADTRTVILRGLG